MQRWHLTLGLGAVALLAAALVPTGGPAGGSTTPPTPPAPPLPAGVDGPLALHIGLDQGAILADAGGERYLVVEVEAPRSLAGQRQPVSVSVVVDLSGSMGEQGKIEGARRGLTELTHQLRPDDRFALTTFSDHATLRAPLRTLSSLALDLSQGLRPEGGTNLYEGLRAGLDALPRGSGEVQRVVLLSDGMANIGETSTPALAALAGSRVGDGVSVSTIGLGLDFNEDLLAQMSDAGGGGYQFVDEPGELGRFFAAELERLGARAARQTRVDLHLAEGVELIELYGYGDALRRDGYSVFLGDLHAGETRKIIARVRVPAARSARPIADATLRYIDSAQDRACDEAARATLEVVASAEAVDASTNRDFAEKAVQARSAALLDQSTRAWQAGDLAGNQALLGQAQALLTEGARSYAAPALAAAAADYAEEAEDFVANAPTSTEGQRQAKRAKGKSRDQAR